MLRGILCRNNPTYTYWSLQRHVFLQWLRSLRQWAVTGTCAPLTALLAFYLSTSSLSTGEADSKRCRLLQLVWDSRETCARLHLCKLLQSSTALAVEMFLASAVASGRVITIIVTSGETIVSLSQNDGGMLYNVSITVCHTACKDVI